MFFFMSTSNWKKIKLVIGVLFPAIVILFSILAMDSGVGSERLLTFLKGESEGYDNFRLIIYKDTLPLIWDNIFLGVGLGNFEQLYPHYMQYHIIYNARR